MERVEESYFSHIPLLSAAAIKTTGPVLELGSGFGSTLLLHGLCGAMGRQLVTLDTDGEWLNKFINLSRSWHRFKEVDSFVGLPELKERWGLAFVDHGISLQRGVSVVELSGSTDIIVCHDSCHFFLYGYEPVLSSFKYRYNFKPHNIGSDSPMTTAVSETVNVGELFAGAGL